MNTHHELALQYLYKSPLENMHASNMLRKLKKYPDLFKFIFKDAIKKNIIKDFEKYEFEMKDKMVQMILGTDMGIHKESHTKLIKRRSSFEGIINSSKIKAKNLNREDEVALLKSMLHLADIGNCGKRIQDMDLWT